jgi:hypothetical protein
MTEIIDLAIRTQALGIELALVLRDLAHDGVPGIPNSSLPGPLCALVLRSGAAAARPAHNRWVAGSTPASATIWEQTDDDISNRGEAVRIILKSPAPGAHKPHSTKPGLAAVNL